MVLLQSGIIPLRKMQDSPLRKQQDSPSRKRQYLRHIEPLSITSLLGDCYWQHCARIVMEDWVCFGSWWMLTCFHLCSQKVTNWEIVIFPQQKTYKVMLKGVDSPGLRRYLMINERMVAYSEVAVLHWLIAIKI